MNLHLTFFVALIVTSCSEQGFIGAQSANKYDDAKKNNPQKGNSNGSNIESENGNSDPVVSEGHGTGKISKCSADYVIPGTANIYFAGSPSSASLKYNYKHGDNTDLASATYPVEIKPTNDVCLKEGAHLTFTTTGNLTHGAGTVGANSPEGNGIYTTHVLGAALGKSDISAPFVSMVAVFIGSGDPSNLAAPARLNFTTAPERNYKILSPLLGQVFFVGDGKTDDGEIQRIVVPKGATRLYMGVWDAGQWNNNTGSLNGFINSID